jgi:hypothetical protein
MTQQEQSRLLPKIPAIIKAAMSAKNRERIIELMEKGADMKDDFEDFVQELYADAEACAQLVIEILQAPLSEAGIDIEIKSRDIRTAELEAYIKLEIGKVF